MTPATSEPDIQTRHDAAERAYDAAQATWAAAFARFSVAQAAAVKAATVHGDALQAQREAGAALEAAHARVIAAMRARQQTTAALGEAAGVAPVRRLFGRTRG